MKILFSCNVPFAFAHGGVRTVIEQLMARLPALGADVEPLQWWEGSQTADIYHHFGRPEILNVQMAQKKGLYTVMTEFIDQTASRSARTRALQRGMIVSSSHLMPGFVRRMNWQVYRELDAMVYAVPHEWDVAQQLFGARPDRGYIIPHGLDESVLNELKQPDTKADYVVSMATIHPRKNTVWLADLARDAQVPIVFIGKPYAENDEYYRSFLRRVDDQYVIYAGYVSEEEKIRYLRRARGFVLLSRYESGCIAVYEAAAAGLPMLLSDLPWARRSYPSSPHMAFAPLSSKRKTRASLRAFYAQTQRQPIRIFPVGSWKDVAAQYVQVYSRLMAADRD